MVCKCDRKCQCYSEGYGDGQHKALESVMEHNPHHHQYGCSCRLCQVWRVLRPESLRQRRDGEREACRRVQAERHAERREEQE